MLKPVTFAALALAAIAIPVYAVQFDPNPEAPPLFKDVPRVQVPPPEVLNPQPLPSPTTPQPASETLPDRLVTILKQDIQSRWRVPVKTLSVTVAEARMWNACMGIPPANNQCAEIGIPGWQVIIKGQNRYWVYNTDSNGKRIAYNANASQPRPTAQTITPKLIETSAIVPTVGEKVIFQSSMVTGEAMAYDATTLSEDGKIRRRVLNRGDKPESKPVVIKTLTPQQVQQFKQVLITHRFNHFDRMSYFNPSAIAVDAVSLQFSSSGSVTEYTFGYNTPKNLTAIANAWDALVRMPK
jgi:hypothetical protein